MSQKKPKMLVVDDEPHILEALSQLFDNDFNVLTATNGTIGLNLIQHHSDTAIVISDQRMPGMKGVEFLKNVKQFSPDSMRILLTGYADLDAVLDSVNVGEVFRYVRKPWVPDTLRSIVALAMASFMLRRQKSAKPKSEKPLEHSETPIVDSVMAQLKPVPQRRRTDEGYKPLPKDQEELYTQPTPMPLRRASDRINQPLSLEQDSTPKPSIVKQQPTCYEEELMLELEAHKAKGDDSLFLSSFTEAAIEELQKFESFEEEFFAKLNLQNELLSATPKEKSLFEKAFHGRSGKPKLLLVDDEAKVLSSLSESLMNEYEVISCTSANAALDILENNSFVACIMTDMRMPQKTGTEFLLQAQSLAPLVPKILMTAYADGDDVVTLINQGMLFRHIQKPWDINKLKTTIGESVDECRNRIEIGMEKRGIGLNSIKSELKTVLKPISKEPTMIHNAQTTMDTLKRLSEFARKSA